jgi:hypothetical protein
LNPLDFDGCKDTLSFEIACLFFACTGASYNEMKLTLTILLQLERILLAFY